MPDKQTILRADADDVTRLRAALAPLVETDRMTPTQFRALAQALAGYVPAKVELAQRTPKGAVYAHIVTPSGETFDFTMTTRCVIQYG